MRLARRVREITPSPTLGIDALAKQMVREGIDVISFSVGEPDFDTPEAVKEEGIRAIRAGFTKYTPASGIPELKEAICRKLKEENGLEYRPDQILVSAGAKHSLYNAFMALCEEGDEVILPAPYWVTYPEQIRLAGGRPVVIPLGPGEGFKLSPEALAAHLTPRTRLLVLNSPSNPAGAVYTRGELEALAEICVRHQIYVISDEVYEKLVYDGLEHVSIASLGTDIKRLTVVVNGVSKAYAMTGWRIGYAAAEGEIIKAMSDLQGHCTSNPTSISQKAALAALNGPHEPVREMVAEFEKRRDYLVERLRCLRGFSVPLPRGAFYVFAGVGGLLGEVIGGRRVTDDNSLARILLEEGRVAVVPGSGFGSPGYLRFSYATSRERIREGMYRLEALLGRS